MLEHIRSDKQLIGGSKQQAGDYDRLPPQNIEAEHSVIGAVLLDNEAIAAAIENLSPNDFYRDAHKKIFASMLELYEKNEPIDLITLTEQLNKNEQLEEIGGASYLSSIVNLVPTSANIRYHAKIVKEKSILRNLISTATEIITTCYDAEGDVHELLDGAETKIFRTR